MPKWVLAGKNLAAQNFLVEYFSFQGGDFVPMVMKKTGEIVRGRESTSAA